MKKLIALLLTAVSLTVILAGCSKGSAPTKPEDVKGETFEGGNISALVPEGWMAFHGTDYFDEYEEGYDPNVIQVCKGAKTEWDLLSKPYVMMTYFSPDNPMYELSLRKIIMMKVQILSPLRSETIPGRASRQKA